MKRILVLIAPFPDNCLPLHLTVNLRGLPLPIDMVKFMFQAIELF